MFLFFLILASGAAQMGFTTNGAQYTDTSFVQCAIRFLQPQGFLFSCFEKTKSKISCLLLACFQRNIYQNRWIVSSEKEKLTFTTACNAIHYVLAAVAYGKFVLASPFISNCCNESNIFHQFHM